MTARIFDIKKMAAVLTGCFFLFGCENKLEDVNPGPKSVGKDEAINVNIKYSIGGRKKAVLTSPLMYRVLNAENYVEFPKTIHVDFYNNAGDTLESRLDAHYAKYQESQSKVFLKDSVKVINRMGDTLYCDELYWDRSKTNQEFYTDKPVRIRRKMEIIDGTGMQARQDFKEWNVENPVGILRVKSAEFPN